MCFKTSTNCNPFKMYKNVRNNYNGVKTFFLSVDVTPYG
jgi:hypothetical protein